MILIYPMQEGDINMILTFIIGFLIGAGFVTLLEIVVNGW